MIHNPSIPELPDVLVSQINVANLLPATFLIGISS
jgi:hypothetical protein